MSSNDGFVYNSQLDAFTLYHIVSESEQGSSLGGGPVLPALGHAVAGGVGSAFAKAIVYPIDLVVTRLQVQRQLRSKQETESAARDADAEYTGLLDAVAKIYKNEGGLPAFFTGCSSDVGKGLIDSFLFFLAYTWLRNRETRKRDVKHLSVPVELAVGVVAGSFSKLCTTPIQNIVTRQQTAALVAARNPDASPRAADRQSIKDIAVQIYRERGLAGFWAGYSASIILTTNPAITFAVDNVLKRLLPRSRQRDPGAHITFLIAAVSKAVATSITYPVQLAKSRAQAGGSGTDDDEQDTSLAGSSPELVEKPGQTSRTAPQSSNTKQLLRRLLGLLSHQQAIYLTLRRIYRAEGLAGLYSGIEGDLVKGFLSHGLTMMTKDSVHVGVIRLYYLLLRLARRWPDDLRDARDGLAHAGRVGVETLVDESKRAQESAVRAGRAGAEVLATESKRAQHGAVQVGKTVSQGTQRLVQETKKAVGIDG